MGPALTIFLNRLSVARGARWGSTYPYDGFGNLRDKTVTAGHDANGNTTQSPDGTLYGYDGENRLTGGGGEGHAPGPDNLRVWKLKTDGTDAAHVIAILPEDVPDLVVEPVFFGEFLGDGAGNELRDRLPIDSLQNPGDSG